MSPLKKLILVDGNALVHRAFHALPPLTTKKGEMVNAVYGFTTLLLKAIADLKPDYVAVAFDLAGPTFRHEAYKEYKATRVKAPDELYAQFDRVKEVVATLNIPIFAVKGFEADDVIGTLSHQAVERGIETIIVTGDMDTLQLVNHLVKVYTMRRGFTDTVTYDSEAVKEKYGLTPAQFVDFKALKGDPSDNIPGIAGIGEKTAASVIQGFGSLDALYQWLDKHPDPSAASQSPVKLSPRYLELLRQGKEAAYASQHLSRIVLDVPISFDPAAAILKDYDRQQAIALFQELEFRSLVSRLPDVAKERAAKGQGALFGLTEAANSSEPAKEQSDKESGQPSLESQARQIKHHYATIDQPELLAKLVKKLALADRIAVDTETDQLNGPIIGLSFSAKAGEADYVPLSSKKAERRATLDALAPILKDPKIGKIGHNIKYDYLALRREGITLAGLTFDTMIASYLLNPANRQHNLDAVAFSVLGIEKIPLAELIGVKKLESLAAVPVEKVAQYACEDADVAWRLAAEFEPQLAKERLDKVFSEIEMPLIPILATMEEAGIKIDCDQLALLAKRLSERVSQLTEDIYRQAGQEFNINSPAQLSVILFERLKLTHPDLKKTKTGLSTAASELDKLKGMHPIVDLLFEYRELTKLLSTYITVLPTLVDKKSRLHTSYSQTVASTGRLASNDPNLQNIPIRTEVGREIRQAFVAEKGMSLVSVDYSQIELRVVAHLSDDPALVKAFRSGRDIHQEVATTLGVDRRVGKTLNFAVLYGQGPYATAQMLGISVAEAKKYIDSYFDTYAGVRRLLDSILKQARESGYVETIFGRRRYTPEIKSGNFNIRAAAERTAMNMPLQGTAADLIKLAMIAIDKAALPAAHGGRMLLQVHDELLFEAPADKAAKLAKAVKRLMEEVHPLAVPLVAEAKVGPNWGALEPLE